MDAAALASMNATMPATASMPPAAAPPAVAPPVPAPPRPVPAAAAQGGRTIDAPTLGAAATAGPPDGYYAAAQGKQGAALLHALHNITRRGHVDMGYAQARDALFGLVSDPAHRDEVADIYTARVETGVSERKTAFAQGLNAEHTWPQSKGATGIAQSDLHQVMPSDITVNGTRGNLPYGEVRDVQKRFGSGENENLLGADGSGTKVFEPRDAIKGDIARALLYFYTRYNQSRTRDYTLENFRHELPTLLQWHQQDPPDAAERTRHELVYEHQRNRNPYVDHPEWVAAAQFPVSLKGQDRAQAAQDPQQERVAS